MNPTVAFRISWVASMLLGCGFVAGFWFSHGNSGEALSRAGLYFIIMTCVHVVGYYYFQNQGTGALRVPVTKSGYWPAIKSALVQQIVILFLAALLLDGGQFLHIAMLAFLGHWITIAMVILRRPRSPTPGDLLIVRYGYPIILLAVAVFGPIVWAARGR